MIALAGGTRVLVATKPVDFRKGAEGLAALVKDQMRLEPFSGVVFVFRSKRADRIKLLWWDGTGVCLLAKRLEDGRFQRPKVGDYVFCKPEANRVGGQRGRHLQTGGASRDA